MIKWVGDVMMDTHHLDGAKRHAPRRTARQSECCINVILTRGGTFSIEGQGHWGGTFSIEGQRHETRQMLLARVHKWILYLLSRTMRNAVCAFTGSACALEPPCR
jgi:hypothetical protein